MWRVGVVFAVLGLGCGVGVEPEALASRDDAVVGGGPESRYPAVGYLLEGDSTANLIGPYCGVTLLTPDLAVTAAHCLRGSKAFGVALGPSSRRFNARAAVAHPLYLSTPDRYQHDMALLVLQRSVTTISPVTIGHATEGGTYRYTGYGRTTPGDYSVTTGYTNERKSTAMTVTGVGELNLFTKGVGGGLCWGDSGGPLMDENDGNTIYGVLADFSDIFTCKVGNEMIFTALDAERGFVDATLACRSRDHVAGCVKGALKGGLVDGGLTCDTFCEEAGLAPGECVDGRACLGLCATPASCAPALRQEELPLAAGGCSASAGSLLAGLLGAATLLRRRR